MPLIFCSTWEIGNDPSGICHSAESGPMRLCSKFSESGHIRSKSKSKPKFSMLGWGSELGSSHDKLVADVDSGPVVDVEDPHDGTSTKWSDDFAGVCTKWSWSRRCSFSWRARASLLAKGRRHCSTGQINGLAPVSTGHPAGQPIFIYGLHESLVLSRLAISKQGTR